MAWLKQYFASNIQPGPPTAKPSGNAKGYLICLAIFAVGTASRIGLSRYWRSASSRTFDSPAGHTYAVSDMGVRVFITPFEGHWLECMRILPVAFLVIGMLLWARSWREWK